MAGKRELNKLTMRFAKGRALGKINNIERRENMSYLYIVEGLIVLDSDFHAMCWFEKGQLSQGDVLVICSISVENEKETRVFVYHFFPFA